MATRANDGRGAARTAAAEEARADLLTEWNDRCERMAAWLPDEHPPFAVVAYMALRADLRRNAAIAGESEAPLPTREQVVARLKASGRDRASLDALQAELGDAAKRAPPVA